MGKRMLIDASHAEELRVAVLNQNTLEDFDFETTTKQQLKGNIYLAKVIRIEPSLQAAFVEFGGNRHGFLAFSEIHPDYYRIPLEDREALLKGQADAAETASDNPSSDGEASPDVEIMGGEDIEEIDIRPQRPRPPRHYKIQEVVTRRQIMLVQVTKEERGGKGAALTTYLSLAGRYCVLMPNASKGGGISRKITNVADRKRLRQIIETIQLPESMSIIVRTAGMSRNKTEIKRDCDYLIKLWNEIREKTLHSVAPTLIYQESNLIKRTLRDYYTPDISEIIIEGEEAYKEARQFIQKLIPSHLKKIKQYKEEKTPLFFKYEVESQIDAIYNPIVHLKSGGYIVFGTTEALVAIDVNSGRATRERHIEETAFKTNLEAAEEVARQLRLRDLAGLVVIDFIDMEESRNTDAVERRLKDSMRNDRARVQVGRISPFGLLELSRQRLRPNIIESTSLPCQACRGSGMIRSIESSSLHILRAIEEEASQQKSPEITFYVPTTIALYILNHKRKYLQDIEDRWTVSIRLAQDDALIPPDYRVERAGGKAPESSSKRSQPSSSGRNEGQKETQEKQKHLRPLKSHRTPVAHKIRSSSTESDDSTPPKENGEEGDTPKSNEEKTSSSTGQRSKSRRRFRKFDRRAARSDKESVQKTETASPSESSEKSSSDSKPPEKKSSPPSPESSAPATPEAAKKDSPSKENRGDGQKGWWQRLLE